MLSVKFREMRTKEMFELGEFRLPRTRMAHAWVYVWMRMGIKPPAVLSIRPSWSSSILLIFSFFKQKRKSQTLNPTFHQHGAKLRPLLCKSSRALTPRTMSPFWERERTTGRLGWVDMRGRKGDVGLPSKPVHDFSPTPCHRLTFFSWVLHGKVGCCWDGGTQPPPTLSNGSVS